MNEDFIISFFGEKWKLEENGPELLLLIFFFFKENGL
jgi:hypothetical protein